VVRIAPNELVFITPQAESGKKHHVGSQKKCWLISDLLGCSDIYTSHTKNQEHFRKVDSGIPLPDDGISFERDPAKHRLLAKKLAGAWTAKSMKTMEPTMHSHIDSFIRKLKEEGDSAEGIDLQVVSAVSTLQAIYQRRYPW
jgi:cytochrome P450